MFKKTPTILLSLCLAGLVVGCNGEDEEMAARQERIEPQPITAEAAGEGEVYGYVPAQQGPYDEPGFVTRVRGNDVYVFRSGSQTLQAFDRTGRLQQTTYVRPNAGPQQMDLIAPSESILDEYIQKRGEAGQPMMQEQQETEQQQGPKSRDWYDQEFQRRGKPGTRVY